MVFLHEGLGSITQWKDFPCQLSNLSKLPALVYDRIGYGASSIETEERENDFMHIEAYHVLPQLLRALAFENRKIILIGHSDGASISLLYASKYPQNIIGVIAIAAHVFVEKITVKSISKVNDLYNQKGKFYEAINRYHKPHNGNTFKFWANRWLHPEFMNWNIKKDIKPLKAPVLIVQGLDDEYGTTKQVDAIYKNVSSNQKEIFLIPNCGHAPHIQAKEELIKSSLRFIESII